MATVWKIGSRWSNYGTPNSSILSIFRRNNIVFVGTHQEEFNKVKKGDYFAIADGYKVVAVAKALDKPSLLKNLKVKTFGYESDRFNYEKCKDWVVGARVKIVDLKDEEKIWYKKRHTFCKANKIWNEVKTLYESQNTKFSINSYTCTLLKSANNYKSVFDTHTRFIIPVYQRPYSWGENEIKPFITDLINNYLGKDKQSEISEPLFIGTMQLTEKKYIDNKEYEQEVIDGQQRLTTLSILLKVLRILFPDCKKLIPFEFNWLESRINSKQNDYLSDFFSANQIDNDINNKYSQNALLIKDTFLNLLEDEALDIKELKEFDINKFCDYLFSSVYFVVIETYAGLSKTLQIFDTINTTGLNLNGGDLFKIRMYEYLTDKRNKDETAFESISEVYQLIDIKNKEEGKPVSNIKDILSLYKNILIAKHNLPDSLFKFGWETFFDRLFDTVLGIRTWEHFIKVLENDFEINIEEIKNVIKIRFEWENATFISIENMFAYNLITKSRYSKYSKIVYLFLYKYQVEPRKDKFTKLSALIILLNKLFFVYSIIYAKSVYSMHSFMYFVQKQLINEKFESVINTLKYKLEKLEKNNKKEIENVLKGYITDNARKKNLICWLSAYFDEVAISNNINEVRDKLFGTLFDIEHIHANADGSIDTIDNLQNSIGNLIILEQDINRRIKNAPYLKSDKHPKCKKEEYKKSKYLSVMNISKNNKWDTEEIEKRRDIEVQKIIDYLFSN